MTMILLTKSGLHESYSCSIGLCLPLYLMPLLNLLLFYPPFLLPLHISPVKHVGLGDLDHTKILRQETIMIVGICVLCTRKGPLEQFAVMVNGQQIGVTSTILPDPGIYCGVVPPARDTCKAKGLSKGQFTIPAGLHTVQIVNIIRVSNDPNAASYSSAFYQLEHQCTPSILPPPACSTGIIQNWVVVMVYNSSPTSLNSIMAIQSNSPYWMLATVLRR